jgi:3-isopropylmalate dehydratase small subunit
MTQSQMSATAPIQFAEIYEKKLQQQEMLVIIEEEKQRQREKEILKEVEEKLERDYKYYQQIKNPDGSSDTPSELGIKKAAESTLDNL